MFFLVLFPVFFNDFSSVSVESVEVDGVTFYFEGVPKEVSNEGFIGFYGYAEINGDEVWFNDRVPKYFLRYVCRHEVVHIEGKRHSEMSFKQYLGMEGDKRCKKLMKKID